MRHYIKRKTYLSAVHVQSDLQITATNSGMDQMYVKNPTFLHDYWSKFRL